jgi:hypothetical protein
MSYDLPYLEKQPVESRVYTFDFTPDMAEDEEITTLLALGALPIGLTLSEQAFAGKRVQVRVAGGTADTQYKFTVVVGTSDNNVLSMEANLFVRDA